MKTNFENAVKILMEGRCESIQSAMSAYPEGYKILNGYLRLGNSGTGINIYPKYFLGQWECLGYKPEMETVEIKRWGIVNDLGKCLNSYASEDDAIGHVQQYSTPQNPLQVVELMGTYQRPVKEKVKLREEIHIRTAGDIRWSDGTKMDSNHRPCPGNAIFFAEWLE